MGRTLGYLVWQPNFLCARMRGVFSLILCSSESQARRIVECECPERSSSRYGGRFFRETQSGHKESVANVRFRPAILVQI
jgi:hypothetical protein